MPRALITGVLGQDGSYLAELLLKKQYTVIGTVRKGSKAASQLLDRVTIVEDDSLDQARLLQLVKEHQPDEVYNLAAQSSPMESFKDPVATGELNGLGVVRLLEAIREACPRARLFQASSSEIFGNTLANPQTEATVLAPRSPYGIAKAYAHWMVQEYRQRHHLYACSGILYNHESPRRSPAFVTRKITQGVARIKKGEAGELRLGNLEAVRDWGFAGDYVRAMWLALRSDHPGDYIIATGKTHTVREFCETAFACAGLDYRAYVVPDADPPRPPETAILVGDPAKAERELGWQREVDFKGLVRLMIDADLHRS